MFIVVGLGNPGSEYDGTRHNVGFMVADRLAERSGGEFTERKFKARLARGVLCGERCLFMKPQCYMNVSGESVGPAAGFFQVPTTRVIVIHDDIDLPLGRMKVKKGGGHGGHNGIRSLMKHLPDAEFTRVRVGVGRPPPEWDPADWVLSRFRNDERRDVAAAIDRAADAVEAVLHDGLDKAMNMYNQTKKSADERSERTKPEASPAARRDDAEEEGKSAT